MLTQFRWSESKMWVQRLQSCYELRPHRKTDIYAFPLEEVLYQLLLQAKLEEPMDTMNHLQTLWRRYHDEHPDFDYSVDDLIREGWLDNFCGHWSLVGYVRQEQAEAVEDDQLREILSFLLWLAEQTDVDRSALYLDGWEEHLTRLREIYPKLPDENWFQNQNILHKDRQHFCNISSHQNRDHVYYALARLWQKAEALEEKRQWAEMAFQLGATADLLTWCPQADWREIMALLTERMLSGSIPDTAEENRRIGRNYMLQSGKLQLRVPYQEQLSDADSTQNLARAQRAIWEEGPCSWQRNAVRFFEVAAVIEYISYVPDDKREDVLARLQKLHHLGLLCILQPFPADATLQLLEYSQTQFMALQTLVQLHLEQYRNGITAAGDCVLAWVSFVMREERWQKTEPLAQLLLYLSEFAYRGTEQHYPESELLPAILKQLSRFCFLRSEFLLRLTRQIVQSTQKAKGITWSRYVQLTVNWAQQIHQAIPADQHATSELLASLSACLKQIMYRLLQIPFNREAAYVPPALMEQPVWVELYVSAEASTQTWMRNPVLSWYAELNHTTEEQFNARYQFRIGLSWLTTLAQTFVSDRAIMNAFDHLLLYVLEGTNQLLSIEYLWMQPDATELFRAIQFLNMDQVGMTGLLKKFQTLRVAELIVLIQYASDDVLCEKLMDLLQEKMKEAPALEEVGWDRLVQYILEKEIEPLYDLCEKRLQEYLTRGRKRGLRPVDLAPSQRMLSWLWYLQEKYDCLLQNGDPYVQAVVYLNDGEHQDLDQAVQCWKKLAENSQEPSVYQNWMLSYLRKLEGTPQAGTAVRRELCRDIEQLRIKIESGILNHWQEEDRLCYADKMILFKTLTGAGEAEAISVVAEELQIDEGKLRHRWEHRAENDAAPETPVQLAPPTSYSISQLPQIIREFRHMTLKEKADCYFNSGRAALPEQSDIMLILLEVFRTLYHLNNFGDKLLFGDTLYEDHCTQLFRECFNLNGSEWWELIANDQQQTGSTGKISGKGMPESAENDLLIKNREYTCMMLEALILTHLDRGKLEEHFCKLIGDNVHNVPMVLLIYGNSTNSNRLWKNLHDYLHNSLPGIVKKYAIEIEPFIPFKNSMFYCQEPYRPLGELAEHSQVTYVRHNGASILPLIVIYVDIGKRGHACISKKARGNKSLNTNDTSGE